MNIIYSIECLFKGHIILIDLFHNSMFNSRCKRCDKKNFHIEIYDKSPSKMFKEKIDFKNFPTQKEWDSNNKGNLIMENICEDCKGEGMIWTEGVILGRPIMVNGKLVTPYETDDKWEKTICHCQSDD